jgi:hypothetical protein
MKITNLAFEESEREEMIKIERQAKGIRYARPTFIAQCDWIQGSVSAQASKDEALAYIAQLIAEIIEGYLAGYFEGVEVWYSDGYMD